MVYGVFVDGNLHLGIVLTVLRKPTYKIGIFV